MKLSMRRSCSVVVAATVAVLAFAAPASAHVRTDGNPVPQGGYGIVRLIVPGEVEGVSTVGLTVTLPDGVDLTSARTLPIPGWTATVEREQSAGAERVAKIVWKATDPAAGYGVAEYREFAFSAGPWPEDVESVALASDQQYSDGSVVAWNEVAVDDASEPEHPAPEVVLAAAEAHGHGDGHGTDAAESAAHADDHHEDVDTSDSSWVWPTVSVVSLVLAVAAVAGVGVVLRRGRGAGS
ncbi:YcnI family copper-binding membrane protein [Rhodococcoides yunnanense]|uniref:YcnI family copper-binding membrane protein n=1 Tax=Rhodococcoides yunnanense TaxID=278209 RepID=UPI0009334E0F|nr:YcnI family protein [Rhodococcus yunnanensis]